MKIVENSTIRVTLSDDNFNKYKCPDRVEILRSGDRRTHSGENETRGRILTDAMRALAARQAISKNPKIDIFAGYKSVRYEYVSKYLEESGRYDTGKLLMMVNAGLRLSLGQRLEYADACTYANRKMGAIDSAALTELGQTLFRDYPDDYSEWRRLTLRSDSDADQNIAEKIIQAARDIDKHARDYSAKFTFDNLHIEILAPDLMPTQIGLQKYEQ